MQQINSYWRVAAVAGLLGAVAASACVVTTTTDGTNGGSSGAGAGAGAGGSGTAGAATAGQTSSAGSATAGAAMVGGSGTGGASTAVPFECDPPPGGAGPLGTPSSCVPAVGTENECNTCIQTSCCEKYSECYAFEPGNQCGWGGPQNGGEFLCVKACLEDNVQHGSGVSDETALGTCANSCATTIANGGSKECMVLGVQTSDLVGCVNDNCQMKCFGG